MPRSRVHCYHLQSRRVSQELTSETSLQMYHTTRHHIPDSSDRHSYRHEKLKCFEAILVARPICLLEIPVHMKLYSNSLMITQNGYITLNIDITEVQTFILDIVGIRAFNKIQKEMDV